MSKSYNSPFEHVDYNAIIDGCAGNGILSGLLVSERGAGQNMSVDVAAGSCTINTTYTEAGTTNVVISNAHATLPRKDTIIYDTTASTPAVITGTAATEPVVPDVTSGDILLGVVYVGAAVTVIANTNIEDGRISVGVIPIGVITMWHGTLATIPTGWSLCDGTSGTPDLRSTFVRGSPAATNPGSTGGSDTHTLTIAEMPAHTHNTNAVSGTSGYVDVSDGSNNEPNQNPTSSTGGGSAHNNMPSYYEIAYIMKI